MNDLEKSRIQEITRLHEKIRVGLAKYILDNKTDFIRIGELLTEQKAGLKHGEWLPWIKRNLPFSDRMARYYMRLFQHREELKPEIISDLTLFDANKLIAEKPKRDNSKVIPSPGHSRVLFFKESMPRFVQQIWVWIEFIDQFAGEDFTKDMYGITIVWFHNIEKAIISQKQDLIPADHINDHLQFWEIDYRTAFSNFEIEIRDEPIFFKWFSEQNT